MESFLFISKKASLKEGTVQYFIGSVWKNAFLVAAVKKEKERIKNLQLPHSLLLLTLQI